MEFGLFLEFPAHDDETDQEAFSRGFTQVQEAESMGVDSVWLSEYHFSPFSVLSAPITIASAIAARTKRIRLGFGVLLLPLNNLYESPHVENEPARAGVQRLPLLLLLLLPQ